MSSPKMARLVPQPEGSQPEEFVHISSFAFIRKDGEVLLVKRSRPERYAGKWCIPGALLLYGEDPTTAASRSVREQLGTTPTALRLVDVLSFGDKHWDLCFVYQAEISGLEKLGQDVSQANYFDLSELPPEIRDDHREVIELARSRKAV